MAAKFAERSFEARFASMGDEAETMFEQTYPKGFVRWGLNRPPIRVSALPPKIRYAPDYLTSDGFIECMGVGRDQILKLKCEKLLFLLQWHHEMPTSLFIWDSKNKRYTFMAVSDLVDQLGIASSGSFPEGKATWNYPINDLAAEWTTTS